MYRVLYMEHRQRAEGIAVNTRVCGKNGGTQHNGESNLVWMLLLLLQEEPHQHSSQVWLLVGFHIALRNSLTTMRSHFVGILRVSFSLAIMRR